METYRAIVVHGATGGEGNYDFTAPNDYLERSPVKVMRHFMKHALDERLILHKDYEIYSALRSKDGGTVTVTGELHLTPDQRTPFMCMISRKPDK